MANFVPAPGVVLVSAAADGTPANHGTNSNSNSMAAVSADGRFVVFNSWGYNLVAGDTGSDNGNTFVDEADTFYKDLQTGRVAFVLQDESGGRPGLQSDLNIFVGDNFSMSADGRYVAFETLSAKLVDRTFFGAAPGTTSTPNITSGDNNVYTDVYVRDMSTGKTWLASSDAAGLAYAVSSSSSSPSLSADGQQVAFVSYNDRLVSGDTNRTSDIFIKTLASGAVRRVSTDSSGTQTTGTYDDLEFSADGHYLVFSSSATTLVPGDTNGSFDIFRKDLVSGAVVRVSTTSSGAQAMPTSTLRAASMDPHVSADGRYVAFISDASDLVAGDTNERDDVFRKDLLTGKLERVSSTSGGAQIADTSSDVSMSADGRYVVFTNSDDSVFPRGDHANGISPDVFIKDMDTGELRLVSDFPLAQPGYSGSQGTISADGHYIVLKSNATEMGPLGDLHYWRVSNPFLSAGGTGGGPGGTTPGDPRLVGTAAADVLTGSATNDRLAGAGGDDTLNGGAGIDTAAYAGARAGYTITRTANGFTVKDMAGTDGTDTLAAIERLEFADMTIAFDTAGTAGEAYRLYQASFNRMPDRDGLGYQTKALDEGLSLSQVAANFIASPEFQRNYGALDDVAFVTQLYQNVLHRAPDADGLRFHATNLADGMARADVLVGFSESPENQLALIGTIQNGMVFSI